MTTQVRNGAQYTLEEATAGLADARLSAVQPVYCLLCIFDKWLHFYILIGNRNNTSEALERPQVPAQTGDESVSNERERLSQEKKKSHKTKKTHKQTNEQNTDGQFSASREFGPADGRLGLSSSMGSREA
jgi:hypothetical protein